MVDLSMLLYTLPDIFFLTLAIYDQDLKFTNYDIAIIEFVLFIYF